MCNMVKVQYALFEVMNKPLLEKWYVPPVKGLLHLKG